MWCEPDYHPFFWSIHSAILPSVRSSIHPFLQIKLVLYLRRDFWILKSWVKLSLPHYTSPAARAGEELIRLNSSVSWAVQKSHLCIDAWHWMKSGSQTAATTFAFSSVWWFRAWLLYIYFNGQELQRLVQQPEQPAVGQEPLTPQPLPTRTVWRR